MFVWSGYAWPRPPSIASVAGVVGDRNRRSQFANSPACDDALPPPSNYYPLVIPTGVEPPPPPSSLATFPSWQGVVDGGAYQHHSDPTVPTYTTAPRTRTSLPRPSRASSTGRYPPTRPGTQPAAFSGPRPTATFGHLTAGRFLILSGSIRAVSLSFIYFNSFSSSLNLTLHMRTRRCTLTVGTSRVSQ